MTKDKDPLFDDLIEALEAMSSEIADDGDTVTPSKAETAVAPAGNASGALAATEPLHVRKSPGSRPAKKPPADHFARIRAAFEERRKSMTELVIQASSAVRHRLLSLADVRTVVRMSVLLVLAGAVTLFFITRPYTSGQADARAGVDPSRLVAKTHTELERVTIRGPHDALVDDQSKSEVHLPPIEAARVDVEELPAPVVNQAPRRVPIEDIRLEQPQLLTGFAGSQNATPIAPQSKLTTEAAPPAKLAEPSPEADIAYKLGLNLLKQKDIAAARLMLKRAADRGHGQAALAFAETHDTSRSQTFAEGFHMDAAVARKYYTIARDLGVVDAAERLSSLGQPGQ